MHRSIRLMSILICLCLISLPGLAFAQQPGQIDPAEMMRLMQQDESPLAPNAP